MKSIFQQLTTTADLFENLELTSKNEIAISTGRRYQNHTELILYLTKRDDTLILTDNGRTRSFMDNIFVLTENDVVKNILAVTDYYGISTLNRQLSIEIKDLEKNFSESFLKMVFCIGFLDAMSIFYV